MSQIVVDPDGTKHLFPDDATPDEMDRALSGQKATAAPSTPQLGQTPSPYQRFRNRALAALPAAYGMAGGFVGSVGGPPGRALGAGIGGAIGELGRQAGATGGQLSPMGILNQGMQQAGLETAGGVAAEGASALARPLMRRALGVGRTLFGTGVEEAALENGLLVSRGGAEKAITSRQDSAKALSTILGSAQRAGVKFNSADVASHVDELLNDGAIPQKEKARIMRQLTDFLREQGTKIEPVLLKRIKQFYQARTDYSGALTLAQSNRAKFSGVMARGAREQLEAIPGVAEREAKTQGLIGAEEAIIKQFEKPQASWEVHKPGSWLMGNSEHLTSILAHVANNPHVQETLLRQGPRAAAALITQLMHTDQPDQTGAGQ